MVTAKRKTVLRTIRLTQELDSLLQKDARTKGTSVNALISELITKYATWDRFTGKFGFVQIARKAFSRIIDAVSDEQLAVIAKDVGEEMPEAVTSFFFRKLNFETLLATLTLYERYSGLQVHEMETKNGECTITFHQEIGRNWLVFLKHFMNEYFKTGLGVAPTTTIVGDSLVLNFRIPENAKPQREHTRN
jgi:hypothetical protein